PRPPRAWGAWLKNPDRSGGGVFDLLIHDFDYCRHLFGKPEAVSASGAEDLEGGIDVVEARLDYGDGVPVIIAGGWHHPESFPFSMEFTILCDGGTLDYSSDRPGLSLYGSDGKLAEVEVPEQDGFVGELQSFVDSCERGVPPADCPPEESAESIAMTLAMRRSRASGGARVTLS
ncbi:MAG: hypothetical protein F4X77_08245, partial [Acidobacteriia bacterium]|nr:hypothetical protein [Terriglobia bacterium]